MSGFSNDRLKSILSVPQYGKGPQIKKRKSMVLLINSLNLLCSRCSWIKPKRTKKVFYQIFKLGLRTRVFKLFINWFVFQLTMGTNWFENQIIGLILIPVESADLNQFHNINIEFSAPRSQSLGLHLVTYISNLFLLKS